MEALYKKLYDKYTKLKKEKDTDLDQLNRDQEAKFLTFVAAADEMIQHLKNENERLNGQVHELKSELASIRSSNDEQHSHLQKLLMEESQKNKELLRLQNIEHKKSSQHVTHEKIGQDQESSPEDAPLEAPFKKRKSLHSTEGAAMSYVDVELNHSIHQHVNVDNDASAPSIPQAIHSV